MGQATTKRIIILEHNSIIPYPKVNQKKLSEDDLKAQPDGACSLCLFWHSLPHDNDISTAESEPSNEPKGVILPVIFNMNEKDHRLFVENMLSTSTYDQQCAQVICPLQPAITSYLSQWENICAGSRA